MCFGWSWYLSVDTQLFLVVGIPLISLFLFSVRLRSRMIVFALLITALVLASTGDFFFFFFPIFQVYRIVMVTIHFLPYLGTDFMDEIYVKPYARMVPFLLGQATGLNFFFFFFLVLLNVCQGFF
jgi:hypothetical protein